MSSDRANGHAALKPALDRRGNKGEQVPEQPAGTPDRTFGDREAYPRDTEEDFGRKPRKAN
jgi:hypothetical protein